MSVAPIIRDPQTGLPVTDPNAYVRPARLRALLRRLGVGS
jgi:hypothetical protein